VAGVLYGRIDVPQSVIILGPNHYGIGARAALYPAGGWLTPLGTVPIDSSLAGLIKKHAPMVEEDTAAHHYEHSLEVQVPFLQHVRPDVTIVPLCLSLGDFPGCSACGEGLARAIKEFGRDVLIVASSDMTHYEPAGEARKKDDLAIGEVLALNPEGLLNVCRDRNISMCGVIPAVTMLVAAKELGAGQAQLVRYATSGDVTGDYRQVVAYAALTVF
jgi:AmmeMemoRadiSam system protein B